MSESDSTAEPPRAPPTASSDRTQAMLAYGALGLFSVAVLLVLGGAYALLTNPAAAEAARANTELAMALSGVAGSVLTALIAQIRDVYGFYFGSSQGSKDKTGDLVSMLAQRIPPR